MITDPPHPPGNVIFDRLDKIKPLFEHYKKKTIVVDESLVAFKGRFKFRQYLPNKRATGSTHQINIYEGKDTKINPPEYPRFLGVSAKIM